MVSIDVGNRRGFTRRKSEGFSGGFTIIEVILFLAISGLLLAVAIASVTANINNSRFNDGVRSTTSFLQSQYSEVASGQSDRDDSRGCDSSGNITNTPTYAGMTNCVIMGRYIKLEGSALTVRYITGYRSSLLGIPADDNGAIWAMRPKVAGTIVYDGTFDVPWNIRLANTMLSGTRSDVTGLAIIKSPSSGNVVYYTASTAAGNAEPTLDTTFIQETNLNRSAVICFEDGGARVGRINIVPGRGQESIQTDLATRANCP